MATLITKEEAKPVPVELATCEDFKTWYVAWNWKPEKFNLQPRPRTPAQRTSSVIGECLHNTKLADASKSSYGVHCQPASPDSALEIVDLTTLEKLCLQSEVPLLQILPYFEIRQASRGGYGAFAIQDIGPRTVILSEPALLQATNHTIITEFEALSPREKEAFMSLANFDRIHPNKIVSIFKTNRFETTARDTCGIFPIASRFNHACYPPCSYRYHFDIESLVLTTKKLISKGQEITISYGQGSGGLYQNWGFICDCGQCQPPVIDDKEPITGWYNADEKIEVW